MRKKYPRSSKKREIKIPRKISWTEVPFLCSGERARAGNLRQVLASAPAPQPRFISYSPEDNVIHAAHILSFKILSSLYISDTRMGIHI